MSGFVKTFRTGLWSVRYPREWFARRDDVCVTLTCANASAFQISAYFGTTRPATDEELRKSIPKRVPREVPRVHKTLPHFEGIYAEYVKDGVFWREWWLRNDRTIVYVTYNTKEANRTMDATVVDRMVDSLRPVAVDDSPKRPWT